MSSPFASASDDLLALHRALVATRSVSHEEGALADRVEGLLRELDCRVDRVGDNVIARAGAGPRVVLCSHLDTVPPCEGWTREPWEVAVEGGKVFGLGSNDAKASVAAMLDTFRRVVTEGGPCEVALVLVPEEETGGEGAEVAWPWLRDEQGFVPEAVVVGEPTNLEVAVAQKGLLILNLICTGDACHSANARALGAANAARRMGHALVRLEDVDLGPDHPFLGPNTLEPTVVRAGEARNQIPDRATAVLDCRTVPVLEHEELVARVQAAVGDAGEVTVHSKRLRPRECPEGAAILEAARRARPESEHYGSATMSDMVYFDGVAAIKVGPGRTERSHRADEFVLEDEVRAGAAYYRRLLGELAAVVTERDEGGRA